MSFSAVDWRADLIFCLFLFCSSLWVVFLVYECVVAIFTFTFIQHVLLTLNTEQKPNSLEGQSIVILKKRQQMGIISQHSDREWRKPLWFEQSLQCVGIMHSGLFFSQIYQSHTAIMLQFSCWQHLMFSNYKSLQKIYPCSLFTQSIILAIQHCKAAT